MRLSKYGKKTVSVILACAMFGTSFAQCAFAEDAADMDVVIEQETQTGSDAATEVEADEGSKQEDAVIDASDELVEDQDSSEESVGADKTADVADEAAEEEPSLAIESISTLQGPMIAPIETGGSATDGEYIYVESEDGIKITGLSDTFDSTKTDLLIPEQIQNKPVTEIGNGVFKGHEHFTGTLSLPTGLKKIGDEAFSGCKFTGALTFKGSIEEIGKNAFSGCCFEGTLTLPASVETIGEGAFENSGNFNGTLTIPSNVTSIGASAFKGCSGFESLSIQATNLTIGMSAFEGCSGLKGTLTMAGVSEIGANAFKDCSGLTALDFAGSLYETIGASAFANCTGLEGTLDLSKTSVTSIGERAFNGCKGLSGLVLPSKLTTIGDLAFEGCTGLAGELKLSELTSLSSVGRRAFYGCKGFEGKLTLPAKLTTIGEEAFYGCSGFIGDLDLSKCTTVGSKAFSGCSGFDGKLTLPEETTNIAKDAIFDSICMADGDTPIEVQVGDEKGETLQVRAGNSNLILAEGLVTWSSGDDMIAKVDAASGKVTGVSAGTATITAKVNYNEKTATKEVNVIAATGIPTVKSAEFKTSVLKPGEIKLTVDIVSKDKAVKTLTGYFQSAAGQKITFSAPAEWAEKPVFSGEKEITVNVPSGAATGNYYLAYFSLTNTDNVTTTYTYDSATGLWKNNRGNQASIKVNNNEADKRLLSVIDGFGKTTGGVDAYITSKSIDTDLESIPEGTTANIQYDANNHTAKGTWFDAIGTKDVMLVLTNGIVEWGFYGKDIENSGNAELDCLVTLAKTSASLYGGTATAMSVKFAQKALPEKATLRIRADQMNGLYQQTNKIYVYTVDETSKKLTDYTTDIPVNYVLSGGQYWYEFTVTSDTPQQLLMSGQKLSLNPIYKVTSIKLSATKLAIAKGKTATLTATVAPTNAANKAVTWKSSNKRVVKVSASGKITAKGYGTATITATAKDGSGKSAKCKVTVGYKIKYKLKGGKNNAKNPAAYYNQKIRLKNPTRAGYKFKGWYTDRKYKHRIKTIPKSYRKNLTLYAKWKKR